MLVLSRQQDESVVILCDGKVIKVEVVRIGGSSVQLGFHADRDVTIHRQEIWERIAQEKG